MKPLKPIRSEADYEQALMELERIFDAEPETPEGAHAEVLGVLISHYEAIHHPVPPPSPIEALRFRMEQLGLNQEEVAALLEVSSGRMSEFMNGKRSLPLSILQKLRSRLQIPADCLLPA